MATFTFLLDPRDRTLMRAPGSRWLAPTDAWVPAARAWRPWPENPAELSPITRERAAAIAGEAALDQPALAA